MASEPKKPRLERPTDRPRPRLPAKGRRWVQQFLIDARWPPTPKLRPLFISQSFLNAFFESEDFGTVRVTIQGTDYIGLVKSKRGACLAIAYVHTAQEIAALLRLARSLTAIEICWPIYRRATNARLMSSWMQVAKELHSYPSLSSIKLTAYGFNGAYTQFLIDSLPDKVTHLHADWDPRIATLLLKRKSPLQEVEMDLDPGNKYYADAFRLKCPKMTVSLPARHADFPHQLLDWRPLHPNEHLKQLRFMMDCEKVDLKDALPHLRSINDHFKLVCDKYWLVELSEPEHWSTIGTINYSAEEMVLELQDAGFGLKSATEDGNDAELWFVINDSHRWTVVSRESVAERFSWADEGDLPWPGWKSPIPTFSSILCGVRILYGLYEQELS